MQSFKQFISEDINVKVDLRVDFMLEEAISDAIVFHSSLEKYFKQHNLQYHIEMVDRWEFAFQLWNLKPEVYGNKSKIEEEVAKLKKHITDVATWEKETFQTDDSQTTVQICCNGIPSHEVDWVNLVLKPTADISLKGIDKIFEKANYLHIYNAHFITSNVLGLFKMKYCHTVFMNHSQFTAEKDWSFIVNKRLNGKRDILQCQDELIEAGLKDYAKF